MNSPKNSEWVEETLAKYIDLLGPEIRSRFVFGFSDEINNKLGDCNQMTKPPLITFYTQNILRCPDLSENLLRELVNHEVLHTFYGAGEATATTHQKTIDFSHKKIKKVRRHNLRNFLLGILIWYCLCVLPPKKKPSPSQN